MLIALNNDDPQPLYQQIAAAVKEQIQAGQLRPGELLPSVRELADALGINLHTVHRAYQVLRDQGVVVLRLGRSARVAPLRQAPAEQAKIDRQLGPRIRELVNDAFHLGLSPQALRQLIDDEIDARDWKRSET